MKTRFSFQDIKIQIQLIFTKLWCCAGLLRGKKLLKRFTETKWRCEFQISVDPGYSYFHFLLSGQEFLFKPVANLRNTYGRRGSLYFL